MKKIILFLTFIFCSLTVLCFAAVAPQDLSSFDKANHLYRQGKFKDAAQSYQSLSDKYPDQAVFFYDLGNSFHRSRELGESILAYEKALLRDPRDSDIRTNLNYVRGLLEYRVEDKRSWILQAAETFLSYFTEKELMLLALICYFILISGWALALFFQRGAAWGWKRKTLSIMLAVCLILLMGKNVQAHFIRDAIVIAPNVQVRYGPSESDQVAFRIGEGIKVYVLDRGENWSRVLLVNGNSGWVKNSEIEQVHP